MTLAVETAAPINPTPRNRSPFHLTDEQVRSFDDNGFLVLKQQVSGELLQRLQEAGDQWIEQGLKIPDKVVNPDQRIGDYAFAARPSGRVLYCVNYLHNKGRHASLELLGCPQVLAPVESLCGPNFLPTYESMVFKMPGDGEAVPWHQDAVFTRRWRVFNYDLYLDPSRAGSGALHVVPRSHRQIHDVCKVRDQRGWNYPGQITIEMDPGDVLIHDDMVLHGSPRVQGKALRRTIYFEFRCVEQVLAEGPWDRDWMEKRLRLTGLALRRHRERYPDASQFHWDIDAQYRPPELPDDQIDLRVVHTGHTDGSYCSAGGTIEAP